MNLPANEYGLPKSTAIFCALEALLSLAVREADEDLFRSAAAAWTLTGYNPQWAAEPLGGKPAWEFAEICLRGRNRRKLRNEAVGLLHALDGLERLGLLQQDWAGSAIHKPVDLPRLADVNRAAIDRSKLDGDDGGASGEGELATTQSSSRDPQ